MNIIEILIGYGLGCVMGGGSLYAFQQEKIKELMEKYKTTQISLCCTFEELKEAKLTVTAKQTEIEKLCHIQTRMQKIIDSKEQEIKSLCQSYYQHIKELTESKEQEIKTLCESQQTQFFELETDYQQQIEQLKNNYQQLENNYQNQLQELQKSIPPTNWWRVLFNL